MLVTSEVHKDLIGPHENWAFVPITKPVTQKMNRILRDHDVMLLFHKATLAYEALKRWDIFRHLRDRIPGKITTVRNSEFLLPCQMDGSDWRFMAGRSGPDPLYWDYCCAHACHWMTVPWLQVCRKVFPEHKWHVLSHHSHTGIVCTEQKLIFDPYFFAVQVPIAETMSLWFNFTDEEDFYNLSEIYNEGTEYTYESYEGTSQHAKRFWELADTFTGDEQTLLNTINSFLDSYDNAEVPEDEINFGLTSNDHLNQDPEALLVLASRANQYGTS